VPSLEGCNTIGSQRGCPAALRPSGTQFQRRPGSFAIGFRLRPSRSAGATAQGLASERWIRAAIRARPKAGGQAPLAATGPVLASGSHTHIDATGAWHELIGAVQTVRGSALRPQGRDIEAPSTAPPRATAHSKILWARPLARLGFTSGGVAASCCALQLLSRSWVAGLKVAPSLRQGPSSTSTFTTPWNFRQAALGAGGVDHPPGPGWGVVSALRRRVGGVRPVLSRGLGRDLASQISPGLAETEAGRRALGRNFGGVDTDHLGAGIDQGTAMLPGINGEASVWM